MFKLSFPQGEYKYPNGVKILKEKIDMLDFIPDGPTNDREYVNKSFSVVFTDSYINKLIKNGMVRGKILDHLREKKRYATIKGKISKLELQIN